MTVGELQKMLKPVNKKTPVLYCHNPGPGQQAAQIMGAMVTEIDVVEMGVSRRVKVCILASANPV